MPGTDRPDPVADDELLYRRIPASQRNRFDPQVSVLPSPMAFRPNENDVTGLSLLRAKYVAIEDAACGRPGKAYYVAILRAGDLRQAGIDVVPRPVTNSLGHAEIPELTYVNRKSDHAIDCQMRLAQELCLKVKGPFQS